MKIKLIMLGLALCILSNAHTSFADVTTQEREQKMTQQSTFELFSLIRSIPQHFPLTKEKMEALIKIPMRLVQENEYIKFFEGGPVKLTNDVVIEKVDLRLHKTRPNDQGFIVLNITGACVKLEEIKEQFGMLEMTDSPRGRSLHDVTSYSAMLSWGRISFSFSEIKPDCLSSIALNPQATSLNE
jgi:hypothetical protein